MKINPIIPIWLMAIICLILITLILYKRKLNSNICIKIMIVVLLFCINLRFMLSNGEAMAMNSDISVLFVIDTSVSMRALDYNGNKERFKAVINDCCHIVDELSTCKFSIITFGDEAKRVIPFTNDTDMVQAELKSINLENDFYAKGSSMNLVKSTLEKTLKDEQNRKNGKSKVVVFFITDGEITKKENLYTFSNMKQYVYEGAVLGYGTTAGGKMINSTYEKEPTSEFYYIYYYDENSNMTQALSKLDEKNLKQIANDLGIDYIHMDKQSAINYKLSNIKKQAEASATNEEKITSYKDIYYYFAVPLVVLLLIDFIMKKKRLC